MKDQLGVTIETLARLPKKKLARVKQFVSQCKKADGYMSIFYWSSIEARKNPGVHEILCYAENEKLVAYVALYHFEAHETEVTLMIDAAYRKTEFYNILWEQIKQAVTQCPVLITRFVFTLNTADVSFKAFVQGLGASVFDSTYKLEVTAGNFSKCKAIDQGALTFRKAVRADVPALMQLELEAFQFSEFEYKNYLLQTADDPDKEIIVAVLNKKIIGKVHVQIVKKSAYLYDLNVDVLEQSKGYGSALIYHTLAMLFGRSFKKVLMDATDESHLGWYENFNFKRIATIEHWKMAAQLSPMKEREKQLDAILLNFHSQTVQDQLSISPYKH